MDERLDYFHAVIVVPDTAPGVGTKTNAREDALVGPAHIVTTIHTVAHG